jgi:hypothetical protein
MGFKKYPALLAQHFDELSRIEFQIQSSFFTAPQGPHLPGAVPDDA